MPTKVLFLCHPEMDHLEYHCFDGLCQICGDENIVTYPYKKIYYGETADDYTLDDGKRGYTSPPEYTLPRKPPSPFDGNVDDFDLVILATARRYGLWAARQIRDKITTQPFIFLEGEDYDTIRWDIIHELCPDIIFKRELRKGVHIEYPPNLGDGLNYHPPVYPFPFSAFTNTKPDVDDSEEAKEISVFSVHGNTFPLRVKVTELLKEMKIKNSFLYIDVRGTGYTWGHRLNYKGYLEHIAKSKIGVSVRGWGRDTLRRWEIPLYETLLFTHDIGIETPYPFEDGKTCVMFKNDLSDFKEKLEYYLQDENECIRIAKEGHRHLLEHHTTEKRAEYVVECIKHL